jgi:thymidine kinase
MANKGKIVIIACLDGTFQRKPFGDVLQLIPMAEKVTKLSAVCMVCKKKASFTRRLGSETQVELIGGSDMYISVCRQCFSKDFITLPNSPPELPI